MVVVAEVVPAALVGGGTVVVAAVVAGSGTLVSVATALAEQPAVKASTTIALRREAIVRQPVTGDLPWSVMRRLASVAIGITLLAACTVDEGSTTTEISGAVKAGDTVILPATTIARPGSTTTTNRTGTGAVFGGPAGGFGGAGGAFGGGR